MTILFLLYWARETSRSGTGTEFPTYAVIDVPIIGDSFTPSLALPRWERGHESFSLRGKGWEGGLWLQRHVFWKV